MFAPFSLTCLFSCRLFEIDSSSIRAFPFPCLHYLILSICESYSFVHDDDDDVRRKSCTRRFIKSPWVHLWYYRSRFCNCKCCTVNCTPCDCLCSFRFTRVDHIIISFFSFIQSVLDPFIYINHHLWYNFGDFVFIVSPINTTSPLPKPENLFVYCTVKMQRAKYEIHTENCWQFSSNPAIVLFYLPVLYLTSCSFKVQKWDGHANILPRWTILRYLLLYITG